MTFKIGALIAILAFTSGARAADIFVREARGNLTRRQATEVTTLVKNAVRNMSEHTLVRSPSEADFTLQPSVVQRGDELVLRVEKQRNGEILAMSEETINSVNASSSRAMAVTETALSDVNYGRAYATDDDGARDGTSSAQSVSASDADGEQGAIDVSSSRKATAAAAPRVSGDQSVGELTAASPRMLDPDRIGQIQLGVGPSFGINMKDDALMYDLMAAYAVDFNENFVGKLFGDFNFATGSSQTRFINLGLAGEFYPSRELLTFGKPYIGADLGYAFTRDGLGNTGDGASAGLTTGFKFQASQLNWDIAANYTVLLERVADATPQVFGIRVALGF
jgi:hypothetical protein